MQGHHRLWTARPLQAVDSKVTLGYGQGQDFESTKSFKFFTVFFFLWQKFDYHEIYVHGVLKNDQQDLSLLFFLLEPK